MMDKSTLDSTSLPTVGPTNPCEIALQSLCKQLLKNRLFRGLYVERRYVENIKSYRDVIYLPKSEKCFQKILCDIREKLQLFYSYQNPQMWIGITSGSLMSISSLQPTTLDTYLWVEIKDLPFGHYWFNIKSIRFRENEIILKLKEVQPVEDENNLKSSINETLNNTMIEKSKNFSETSDSLQNVSENINSLGNQVTIDAFVLLLKQWWESIKQTVYNFMAQDISKENLKAALRFFGLLIISAVCGAFESVKFLGIFILRFMFEFSRLTKVSTPIILKIIDVLGKIIGSFFILFAMIWKDLVVNRSQPKPKAVQYNQTIYKSIQYYEGQNDNSSRTPTNSQ